MRKLDARALYLSISLVLAVAFLYAASVEACGDSAAKKTYAIEQDDLGRLIAVWCEDELKQVQLSIDGGSPQIISNAGQVCYSPQLHVTEAGDVIVLWTAMDDHKTYLSPYIAFLPFGGKWSKPICLGEQEYIVPNTHRLIVSKDNQIRIHWESALYIPSTINPEQLVFKKELRLIKGTMDSFEDSAKTLAVLRHDDA